VKKRGYEFGFAWIFAIFVGAFILFLAIYITTQVIDTERTRIDTVRAKEIGILLTPVETNLEQAKLATIIVPQATRLNNNCSLKSEFGEQKLSAFTKSNIGEEWRPIPGVESTFHNKYLFSSGQIEAEDNFYIFTKPFKYPFKIADLTMIWPDKEEYCFVFSSNSGKQRTIRQELDDIEPENIQRTSSQADCSAETTKTVCFTGDCDIQISLNQETVTKRGLLPQNYVESLDNNDRFALLFAAVFSDSTTYNCQVERLTRRAANLADLYKIKSNYLTPKGCSSSPVLPSALISYKSSMLAASSNLKTADFQAKDLKNKNERLSCRLF
jgi:hypothetical protein